MSIPEETNRPSWSQPASAGTPTHHCPWVLGLHFSPRWDIQTLLQLCPFPCLLYEPCSLTSVGTLAGPISFCSQLDSLKVPWTQFITCHAGTCQWTLLPVPGSDSIFSSCRTAPCQCKHSLSRVTLDAWFVSLVEQSCSCHSLIYGSSYYGEFLPG